MKKYEQARGNVGKKNTLRPYDKETLSGTSLISLILDPDIMNNSLL